MCAIKNINFEFILPSTSTCQAQFVHYTSVIRLICCLPVSPTLIIFQFLFVSHTSSLSIWCIHAEISNKIHWHWCVSYLLLQGRTHHFSNISKFYEFLVLTPMWQNVTFAWAFCVCGWNAEKLLNMIWGSCFCMWAYASVCLRLSGVDQVSLAKTSITASRTSTIHPNEIKW